MAKHKKNNFLVQLYEGAKQVKKDNALKKPAGKLVRGDRVRAIINGQVSSLEVIYTVKLSGQLDMILIGFNIGPDVLPFEYDCDQEVTLMEK